MSIDFKNNKKYRFLNMVLYSIYILIVLVRQMDVLTADDHIDSNSDSETDFWRNPFKKRKHSETGMRFVLCRMFHKSSGEVSFYVDGR